MKRWLTPQRYHWTVVFIMAGLFAAGFAYASYNLFHTSMANLNFIQRHGFTAIREGALIQLAQIALGGSVALFCFLGFKLCEGELITRFRRWTQD